MKRVAALAVLLVAMGAALSGCATPCCFCYCGDVPTQGLLDAAVAPRAEVPVPSGPSVNNVVVARY